jgi:hypothetical protein
MDVDDPGFFEMFENAPQRSPREIFARRGFVPTSPDELTGGEMRGRLWELIHACAAQRFFFYDTNHLDDKDFYLWLDRFWLDQATDDLPPEAEMNCHISPGEPVGDPEGDDVWLRFYADEGTRAEVEADGLGYPLPPHETPQFDRDRFLPTPYHPAAPVIDDDDLFEEDPLGLKKVDREIRRSRQGGGNAPDEPEWESPALVLKREGFTPLPPPEITPEAQGGLLWELLHELSCRGFYAVHTDHLDDAALYFELWRKGIREDAMMPGATKQAAWFYDFSYDDSDDGAEEPAKVADRDWRLPRWRYDMM